jgi:hypothetical protein
LRPRVPRRTCSRGFAGCGLASRCTLGTTTTRAWPRPTS